MRITRTHVAMTAIPGLALVAGALIGGPSPSSALEQPRTIALVLANERFRSASDFVDLIPRSNTNTDVVEAWEPGGGLLEFGKPERCEQRSSSPTIVPPTPT